MVTYPYLAALTASAILVLGPLIVDVMEAIGDPEWEPVLGVFGLTYILLLGFFGGRFVSSFVHDRSEPETRRLA